METPECCYLHKAILTFENGIRELIQKKVSKASDAEDIAQEVFLKVSLAHSKNEHVSNVKSWIYSVTSKTIFEYYRKKYRSKESLLANQQFLPDSEFFPAELCACDFILPLISLLPEKYRVPLHRSDIENTPQKVVAQELSLGLPALKSRIRRARIMLRELFSECTHIEYDTYGNVFSFEIKETCKPLKEARDKLNKKKGEF